MSTQWRLDADGRPSNLAGRSPSVPKTPVNVTKAIEAWKDSVAVAGRSAGLILGGEAALVAKAQERFSSGGTLPGTWAGALGEVSALSSVSGEILVLFVDSASEAEALAGLERGVPKGGVVLVVDEGDSASGSVSSPVDAVTRLSFSDEEAMWSRLFEACASEAGDNVVALGRRYPALRRHAARRVIYGAAGRNALVGALFFLPGTDLPAMTLNQAKMVLALAGIYGASLDRERAVELVGLVGIGFGLRTLARALVGATPGLGWVVKASTGFTGTVAIGHAAMRYFEGGAPANTGRVMGFVSSFRR